MDEQFTEEIFTQFDAVRRMGVCNMLDRACVLDVAFAVGHDDLADIAADKRRYPKLLVWFANEAEKRDS